MDPEDPLQMDTAVIPNDHVTLYREGYYRSEDASDLEGGTGMYPDALIPSVDPIVGEARRAFSRPGSPFHVPAGNNRVAWVDVFVPEEMEGGGQYPAGLYEGTLLVSGSGTTARVPVTLEVLDFTIPPPGDDGGDDLTTVFDFNHNNPCKAHGNCPSPDTHWELQARYLQAALDNRISFAHISDTPAGASKERFETYILPFVKGTSDARIANARVGPIFLFGYCETQCLEAWKAEAAAESFTNTMVFYASDEPYQSKANWEALKGEIADAHSIWPGIRTATTAMIQDASDPDIGGEYEGLPVAEAIDIFIPLVQGLHGREYWHPSRDKYEGNQRATYDDWLSSSPDRELWAYTACDSFYCNSGDRSTTYDDLPYYTGWPGYAIDAPAVQHRTMGWLAYYYDLTGEYYYDMVVRLTSAWTDQYAYGANGDGTLFYPGIPQGRGRRGDRNYAPAIGGQTHIPIESIRLKRIRDGREDYSYLAFLRANGKGAEADAILQGLFGSDAMYASVTPSQLKEARDQLIALIRSP